MEQMARARLVCTDAGFPPYATLEDSETGNSIIIGRSRTADYRVNHPQVSGFHCTLTMRDGKLYLKDTSTNGTHVNGREVGRNETVELSDGATVTLLVPTIQERDEEFGDTVPAFTIELSTTGDLPPAPPPNANRPFRRGLPDLCSSEVLEESEPWGRQEGGVGMEAGAEAASDSEDYEEDDEAECGVPHRLSGQLWNRPVGGSGSQQQQQQQQKATETAEDAAGHPPRQQQRTRQAAPDPADDYADFSAHAAVFHGQPRPKLIGADPSLFQCSPHAAAATALAAAVREAHARKAANAAAAVNARNGLTVANARALVQAAAASAETKASKGQPGTSCSAPMEYERTNNLSRRSTRRTPADADSPMLPPQQLPDAPASQAQQRPRGKKARRVDSGPATASATASAMASAAESASAASPPLLHLVEVAPEACVPLMARLHACDVVALRATCRGLLGVTGLATRVSFCRLAFPMDTTQATTLLSAFPALTSLELNKVSLRCHEPGLPIGAVLVQHAAGLKTLQISGTSLFASGASTLARAFAQASAAACHETSSSSTSSTHASSTAASPPHSRLAVEVEKASGLPAPTSESPQQQQQQQQQQQRQQQRSLRPCAARASAAAAAKQTAACDLDESKLGSIRAYLSANGHPLPKKRSLAAFKQALQEYRDAQNIASTQASDGAADPAPEPAASHPVPSSASEAASHLIVAGSTGNAQLVVTGSGARRSPLPLPLTTFDASDCKLTTEWVEGRLTNRNDGACKLLRVLGRAPVLYKLCLSGNGLCESAAATLAQWLGRPHSPLVHLELMRNPIGDEGLSHLCRALRTNQTLRTLHLDECMLTDRAVPPLEIGLSNNATLKTLGLAWNGLGAAAAIRLLTSVTDEASRRREDARKGATPAAVGSQADGIMLTSPEPRAAVPPADIPPADSSPDHIASAGLLCGGSSAGDGSSSDETGLPSAPPASATMIAPASPRAPASGATNVLSLDGVAGLRTLDLSSNPFGLYADGTTAAQRSMLSTLRLAARAEFSLTIKLGKLHGSI